MKSFVKLSRYRDSKNGQKHKKSSTDVGLWKIQFVVKAVKSLIIVWIKSLVNWNEVSRGFCGHFLPTGAGKKWPKQLDGIRTSRRLKGLQHSSSLSWLAGNIRRTRALWFSRHLHCPLITQAVAERFCPEEEKSLTNLSLNSLSPLHTLLIFEFIVQGWILNLSVQAL